MAANNESFTPGSQLGESLVAAPPAPPAAGNAPVPANNTTPVAAPSSLSATRHRRPFGRERVAAALEERQKHAAQPQPSNLPSPDEFNTLRNNGNSVNTTELFGTENTTVPASNTTPIAAPPSLSATRRRRPFGKERAAAALEERQKQAAQPQPSNLPHPAEFHTLHDNENSVNTTEQLNNGNVNADSIGTQERQSFDADEEQEQEEPSTVLVTAQGEPSLPHILKIGQESFAEYITLKQIPIGTNGHFDALQTGSKDIELRRKYGIETDDDIAAMQRAFGVHNQHQTPPIIGFIEKKCVPKGFGRVRTALEMRLDTLSTNIDLVRNSMAVNPMMRRRQWIEDILDKTHGLGETCQGASDPSAVAAKKPISTSGCPCLDELGLLRNLTYIISFLTGTTDPQVKQQLEKITLQRMLNAAQKGNTTQASKILKDIIGVLEAYIQNPERKNISEDDERIQSILKPIYTTIVKMHGKSNTRNAPLTNVTTNMIMAELNKIVGILEASQKKKDEYDKLSLRIQDMERELAEEKGKEAVSTAASAQSQQQITALQEAINALTVSLQDAQTQLAQTQSEATAERTTLQTRIKEMETQVRTLEETIEKHEQTLREKESDIQQVYGDLGDEKDQKSSFQEIIKRLTEEKQRLLEAHTDALAEIQQQIQQKESEIQTLRDQLKAATEESAEKSGQEEIISGHLQTLSDSVTRCEEELSTLRKEKDALEATNRELTQRFSGLETQFTEVQSALTASREQVGRNEARIQDLESELGEARQQLETKTAEKSKAEEELQDLRKRIEEQGSDIARLKEQITQISAEKDTITKELEAEKSKCADAEAAKAQYEKEMADIQKQLGEIRALEGTLRAELASATAEGQSSKSENETLEKELAAALAKIASLEASLEQVTSKSAASQSKLDEAHKAEVSALQSELDQTRAEVERVKEIAQSEREALIRAQEEEIAGKKAEIEGIEKQLAAAVQTASNKGLLEAEMVRKNAELEAAKNALADLRAELAQRPTKANLDQRNAALAKKDAEILEKETKIQGLEANLLELKVDFDTLRGEKDTLLSGLGAAQDAMESMITAEKGAEKDAEIEKLKEALAHASSVVDAQGAALAEAQGARDVTKDRLNVLLGHLLINPELRSKAHAFLNGDDSAVEPIKRDLCDLYGYLANIINLQMRKIDSTGLPKEAKDDIFSIFKHIPVYDSRILLSELNSVFQELFIQVAQTSTIPDELVLQKQYPELAKTLGAYNIDSGQPLKYVGPMLNAFIVELGTFGYMNAVYVEPRPSNFFILKKKLHTTPFDFANKNTTHMTPLVILGIKMIQIMASLLKEKYSDLSKRCGAAGIGVDLQSRESTPTPVAEEDVVALAKREFDNSVSQLTSNLLRQHIIKYTNILNDPKAMLGAEKLKHFPKHIAYAVLLSMYSHHLTKSNPRLHLRTAIQSSTDVLDSVIRKLELDAEHPEYTELIRKAREYGNR